MYWMNSDHSICWSPLISTWLNNFISPWINSSFSSLTEGTSRIMSFMNSRRSNPSVFCSQTLLSLRSRSFDSRIMTLNKDKIIEHQNSLTFLMDELLTFLAWSWTWRGMWSALWVSSTFLWRLQLRIRCPLTRRWTLRVAVALKLALFPAPRFMRLMRRRKLTPEAPLHLYTYLLLLHHLHHLYCPLVWLVVLVPCLGLARNPSSSFFRLRCLVK